MKKKLQEMSEDYGVQAHLNPLCLELNLKDVCDFPLN